MSRFKIIPYSFCYCILFPRYLTVGFELATINETLCAQCSTMLLYSLVLLIVATCVYTHLNEGLESSLDYGLRNKVNNMNFLLGVAVAKGKRWIQCQQTIWINNVNNVWVILFWKYGPKRSLIWKLYYLFYVINIFCYSQIIVLVLIVHVGLVFILFQQLRLVINLALRQ